MNVSNHAKERYVERIKGITNEQEMKQYIARNGDQLIQHILKLQEHSQLIWKGQLGDNVTRHYFIKDDTIIITDTQNTAIVTLYKINYGYQKDLNMTIAKTLLAEVDTMKSEAVELESKIKNEIEAKAIELEGVSLQKKILLEQADILSKREKALQADIESIRSGKAFVDKEMEKIVLQLVNSIDYRNDLKSLKKLTG